MNTLFADFDQEEKPSESASENITSKNYPQTTPLAERMRPRSFDEVLGQEHLTGEGSPLRAFAKQGLFPSLILWGAPGIGKTTLALIIAESVKSDFVRLSAVEAGVKDVREVLQRAEKRRSLGKQTLLFIDEIHRFNKNQQDALLHAVEQGIITLVGATTENPSFEVNPALLSRCRVYTLRTLSENDASVLIQRAFLRLSDDLQQPLLPEDAHALTQTLYHLTGGDARGILNALEAASNLVFAREDFSKKEAITMPIIITQASIEEALQQKTPRYDKKGEGHYDTISAFIKSLRGSDPDAALFWLATMLEGGEDPKFIARRMVVFASEDIGNAAPEALSLALSVFRAVEIIGMPECRINLAQGVTFLASCPKSNASYRAVEKALADIRAGADTSVPLHLRNAPTKLMKQEGYGREYKYPHDFEGHFVQEHYFPKELERLYYKPTEMGKEQELKQYLEQLRPERYQ